MKVTPKTWLALCAFVLVSFLAGAVGTMLAGPMPGQWYQSLAKPSFNPPAWVFGPVWSVLYLLIGVAAWQVWRTRGFGGARAAMVLFAAQWVLNAAWTGLFFGLESATLGLVDIVALWVVIVAMVVAFFRASVLAGVLILPYLLWVSFATVLNSALWWLNR